MVDLATTKVSRSNNADLAEASRSGKFITDKKGVPGVVGFPHCAGSGEGHL